MSYALAETLGRLRDPSQLAWYVIPLVALTIYVYAVEVERRSWSLVFCGLAFWGMDWLNEIANGVLFHLTGRPLWSVHGDTAYVILIGLNLEIAFIFAIGGIALGKMLPKDPRARLLGLPNRLAFSLLSSSFCVLVEVLLHDAGLLGWHWRLWDVPHLWAIVLGGYLHFHLVAFWVHDMERVRDKAAAVAAIWGIAAAGVLVFGGLLEWL